MIEHEDEDPDGVIDEKDLANSLGRICYEDRAKVYDSALHYLDVNFKLDALQTLLTLASPGFPTLIDKNAAAEHFDSSLGPEDIQWLIDHNILRVVSDEKYGLVDEFLRIRMMMDEQSPMTGIDIEETILEQGSSGELDKY